MQNNCIGAAAVAIGRLAKSLSLYFFTCKITDRCVYCLMMLCACAKMNTIIFYWKSKLSFGLKNLEYAMYKIHL